MIYDEHSVGGLVAALEASCAFSPLNQHLSRDIEPVPFLINPSSEYSSAQPGHKHLYAPASLIADALSERLDMFAYKLDKNEWICGRIVCDSDAPLNASSVLIEEGRSEKCLRSRLLNIPNSICLFPGQMVAVKGEKKYLGAEEDVTQAIRVSDIITTTDVPHFRGNSFPMRVCISHAQTARFDVQCELFVLLGPFPSEAHSPEAFHRKYIAPLNGRHAIIVPSRHDLISPESTCLEFPQPAVFGRNLGNVHFASNPDMLVISFGELEWCLGVCSENVTNALMKEAIPMDISVDAACQQLLAQSSYVVFAFSLGFSPSSPLNIL